MGRRFGWDDVLQNAGDSNVDGLKVLENVKKRKEKAKKKKAANREEGQEEGGSDDDVAPKPTSGDAFEDVLYGSDSDVENGSDGGGEDEPRAKTTRGRPVAGRGDPKGKQNKQNKRTDTRIRVDNDEPMDLLHGGAANTATADQKRRRQPGQEASRFKTDEGTGRLIIENEPTDTDMGGPGEEDVAGVAYREQITSVDGFTRGPKGQVKFNKNTKKRRAEEAQDGDVEMADGSTVDTPSAEPKKKKRTEPVRLGQEFKAKNAGGDVVRRNQQDPYAYLPLSHIGSKKKGGKIKYNITGKR